jgi:hypothetical protein
MTDPATDNKAIDEVALDHAWKWFEYHATQRMTMIRFYVIAAGGIAAGTGYLLTSHENFLAGALAVIGAITTLAFKRLDKRVSDLVRLGEEALSPEQAKMGTALNSKAFEICRLAAAKPVGAHFYTYGENFRLLFAVIALGFAVVAVIGFARFGESYVAQICRFIG